MYRIKSGTSNVQLKNCLLDCLTLSNMVSLYLSGDNKKDAIRCDRSLEIELNNLVNLFLEIDNDQEIKS